MKIPGIHICCCLVDKEAYILQFSMTVSQPLFFLYDKPKQIFYLQFIIHCSEQNIIIIGNSLIVSICAFLKRSTNQNWLMHFFSQQQSHNQKDHQHIPHAKLDMRYKIHNIACHYTHKESETLFPE